MEVLIQKNVEMTLQVKCSVAGQSANERCGPGCCHQTPVLCAEDLAADGL